MPINDDKSPRSVLHVNTRDQYGGAEGSAWNLFKAMQTRGMDAWFAVGFKHSDDPNVFVIPNATSENRWVAGCKKIGARDDRPHIHSGVRQRIANSLRWLGEPHNWREHKLGMEIFRYPGTRRLLDLPPRMPDIVHCHNLHGGYFDLRALADFSHRVPVILNLRDTWAFTGHCAGFMDCDVGKPAAAVARISRFIRRSKWIRPPKTGNARRAFTRTAASTSPPHRNG